MKIRVKHDDGDQEEVSENIRKVLSFLFFNNVSDNRVAILKAKPATQTEWDDEDELNRVQTVYDRGSGWKDPLANYRNDTYISLLQRDVDVDAKSGAVESKYYLMDVALKLARDDPSVENGSITEMSLLRKVEAERHGDYSAEMLGIAKDLPTYYAIRLSTITWMCAPRALPRNAEGSCPALPGEDYIVTCELTCKKGWVAYSNIRCITSTPHFDSFGRVPARWTDQRWSALKSNPRDRTGDTHECREAVCRPVENPVSCPHERKNCFKWKDSACERGGLSVTQKFCEVVPAAGYMLADPNANTTFTCEPLGKFSYRKSSASQILEGSGTWYVNGRRKDVYRDRVVITEATCDCSRAIEAGLVDKASGVMTICGGLWSAVSGFSDNDLPVGYVEVTCTQGFRRREENALRCLTTGLFEGKAACEPITCATKQVLSQKLWGVSSDASKMCGGLEKVAVGGACPVTCEEGRELRTNSLLCSKAGLWEGAASCKRSNGRRPDRSSSSQQSAAGTQASSAAAPVAQGNDQSAMAKEHSGAPARGAMYALFLLPLITVSCLIGSGSSIHHEAC
eukprot:TRINITY_DN14566_c0_g1_i2.p1 TRINITY_DN14566_c0_g1~~TRINITY_DN14566_c0_g1_i2.p1  ORF type:complete len:568 (-),score=74.39 TRINITY_DN14566_c0_g1_i2:25-1728(-)